MLKIRNFMHEGRHSTYAISESYLDYLPKDRIVEVHEGVDCDISFLLLHRDNATAAVSGMYPDDGVSVKWLDQVRERARLLTEKPRLFFVDALGMDPRVQMYPEFVMDTDIVTAVHALPAHPNFLASQFIDPRRFFQSGRMERVPKTAAMINDHFLSNAQIVRHLLREDILDRIFVTGIDQFSDDTLTFFEGVTAKLTPVMLTWPDGIRKLLNQVEFHISLIHHSGMEMMGFEAGFCGAQPIYIGNKFYEFLFEEDIGIGLVDPVNIGGSLETLLTQLSAAGWQSEHQERFIKNHSAAEHLPSFWDGVIEVLS